MKNLGFYNGKIDELENTIKELMNLKKAKSK